jgi:hypothetical protein
MRSKLFHAVVGVGISLGSAAACGGSVASDLGAACGGGSAGAPQPDAGIDVPKPDAAGTGGAAGAAGAGGAAGTAGAGGSAGAPVSDAGLVADASISDASKDVIVEAFCDVSWPITKSGREVCGPYEACETKEAPWCFGKEPQGTCKLYPVACVGAEWQCLGGATPTQSPAPPPGCP